MTSARVIRALAWDDVPMEGGFVLWDGAELRLLAGTAAHVYGAVDGVSTNSAIADRLAQAHLDDEVRADVLHFLGRLARRRMLRQRAALTEVGYVRPASTAFTRDGEIGLLADLRTGRRRALTATGMQVWDLVCLHGCASDVLEALRDAHPEASLDMDGDVKRLLGDLVAAGLLNAVEPEEQQTAAS